MWFGNEAQPDETNPVVGTAQVLTACAELERLDSDMARRAANWLLTAQHAGGGWGPPRVPLDYSGTYRRRHPHLARERRAGQMLHRRGNVAGRGRAPAAGATPTSVYAQAVSKGLTWLADAVEQDRHRRPAVIGCCFPRLWYHERLYPLLFAAGALSRRVRQIDRATPGRRAGRIIGRAAGSAGSHAIAREAAGDSQSAALSGSR